MFTSGGMLTYLSYYMIPLYNDNNKPVCTAFPFIKPIIISPKNLQMTCGAR